MFFLVSSVLASANGRPSGRISRSRARPIVVSTIEVLLLRLPSSAITTSVMRTLTLACSSHHAVVVGALHFGDVGEHHALALLVLQRAGHVVQAQHDVLRRHDDRLAVGRRQDVVGRHHQRARFQLGFQRERHVDGHLVTVEVGVERGADQRVQLDGLAFDQHRLERLDAEAMQGRGAVQQHRMLADDFFQDVPDFRFFALDQLLGGLDGRGQATTLQLGEDEGLEQLQRHLLRQAALVQAQGTDRPR